MNNGQTNLPTSPLPKTTSPSASPLPPKPTEANEMLSFAEAIDEVRRGKKIHKLEWKNKQYYGFLHEARLRLHEPNGKLHEWLVSEGDIIGNDWIVV